MKHKTSIAFSLFVGLAVATYAVHSTPNATDESSAKPVQATVLKLSQSPSLLETIPKLTPPANQTTLHSDTEMETELLASLSQDKILTQKVRIESVNCDDSRCQVLVEPLATAPQDLFFEHLAAHPEFGRSLRVSTSSDKENKNLITFVYSQETQVSAAH